MVFNRLSIPTVTGLKHQRGLLDRHRLAADRVIAAMRDEGLALHCSHEKSGTRWWLSDGRPLQPEIAKLVTINADITSVGDGLFSNAPGQTFRVVK